MTTPEQRAELRRALSIGGNDLLEYFESHDGLAYISQLEADADTLAAVCHEIDCDEEQVILAVQCLERNYTNAAAALAECRRELGEAQARERMLREALPPAHRLRLLAMWIDMKYPDDPNPEVQDDLRKWANAIDAALANRSESNQEAAEGG